MATLDQMMLHKMGTRVYFRIPHTDPPKRLFVHGVQGPDFKVGIDQYDPERQQIGWRRIETVTVNSEQAAWTMAEQLWEKNQ